jgi:hypothetical protein
VPTKEEAFVLLSGEPKIYVKVSESGNWREQAFCSDCGTPIYSAPTSNVAKVVSLRVGTIHQRDQLPPTDQYRFRSAQKWLQKMSVIKRMDKQPIFDPKGGFRR